MMTRRLNSNLGTGLGLFYDPTNHYTRGKKDEETKEWSSTITGFFFVILAGNDEDGHGSGPDPDPFESPPPPPTIVFNPLLAF